MCFEISGIKQNTFFKPEDFIVVSQYSVCISLFCSWLWIPARTSDSSVHQ